MRADRLYDAQVKFFDELVKTTTFEQDLEKVYLPRLLTSLINEALHPLIHLAMGMEFQHPLVVSEALSYASLCYLPDYEVIVKTPIDGGGVEKTALELAQEIGKNGEIDQIREKLLALDTIIARSKFVAESFEALLIKTLNNWISFLFLDPGSGHDRAMTEGMRQLYILAAHAYLSTLAHPTKPHLDFFLMHGVTAMHAARVVLQKLRDPQLQILLLKTSFLGLLLIYIVRGRPPITNSLYDTEEVGWNEAIQLAIDTDEEHVSKVVRSMHEASKVWGDKEAFFLKVAATTAQRIKKRDDFEFKAIYLLEPVQAE